MPNKLKVLVLAGGLSEEREVSLTSARAVVEALNRLGHQVQALDTGSGQSLLDSSGKYLLQPDDSSESKLALKQTDSLALTESIRSDQYKDADVVFIALHGGAGEDGTMQALLDLAGMKYTGSGMLASALAMDKAKAKKLAEMENIITPRWRLLRVEKNPDFRELAEQILDDFTPPIIVKPNNSGSTVGLTLVKDKGSLASALKSAFDISRDILIEEYIKGREITVAVLGGEPLPPVEIIPSNELYDYQCKYTKGKSQYICPAEIAAEVAQQARQDAVKAYELIGCSGLARIDFILDSRNCLYFLEVNTIPGMTELSLAPMAAREAGIDFDELIERLCHMAAKE
jgi:D-alanine-D-alanine ligase